MNQPDLGLKVAELRQQQGLTQERLAELCEVSLRTIQRIESGEVDPRAYTVHCLGEALHFDFGPENTAYEDLWLAALHLSSIVPLVLIPLVLWSWKKNQSYKVDQQGRQVLNFQITMTFLMFAGTFILMVGLPALLAIMMALTIATQQEAWQWLWLPLGGVSVFTTFAFVLIAFYSLYQATVNTIRALSDKPIHYELSIPLIR